MKTLKRSPDERHDLGGAHDEARGRECLEAVRVHHAKVADFKHQLPCAKELTPGRPQVTTSAHLRTYELCGRSSPHRARADRRAARRRHPPGSPIREAFLERGVRTFHQACAWVKSLPYGPNPAGDNELALFNDGCGTCATKHGVIAALAAELRLNVHKTIGLYRLNDEIVTGVDAILARHGLPFIPQIHCFLECGGRYVDLTEGNITGKNKTIGTYDFIGPCAARAVPRRPATPLP